MKAYFEYEDGTFWAIRAEGENCFTAGGKDGKFWPELMLKAGTEEEKHYTMPPDAKRLSFTSPAEAEEQAAKMIGEKSEKNESGSPSLKQDAEYWKLAVKRNACCLFFVPDEYKTKKLCAMAVRRDGWALQYVPSEIQDAKICELALNKNAFAALKYMSENLITEEICQNAVKKSGAAFRYVPDKFKTEELCLYAVKNYGRNLECVPEKLKTPELCIEAVKGEPRALKYVPEALKTLELCLEVVSHHDSWMLELVSSDEEPLDCVLAYVPKELITAELCTIAVKAKPESLKFVPSIYMTPQFFLDAVNGAEWKFMGRDYALKYVPENIKTDEFLAKINQKAKSLKKYDDVLTDDEIEQLLIPINTMKFKTDTKPSKYADFESCLEAVRKDGSALRKIPEEHKTWQLCVTALQDDSNGSILDYVPDTFKTKEFCLNSVSINGANLSGVPETLKTYDICLQAIRSNPRALTYVPAKFLTQELCMEAVKLHPFAIEYVPLRFLTPALWKKAIAKSGDLLIKLPAYLFTEELCRLAVANNGRALEFVPDSYQTKELCFAAVKQDGKALRFVDVKKLTAEEYTEICRIAFDRKPDGGEK